MLAFVVGALATARPAQSEAAPAVPAAEPPLLTRFRIALDAVVARARPDGGWVFGTLPGERVHPHTDPLQFAERVAAPFGLADWDLVVMRSPGTPAGILALLTGHRLLGDDRYRAAAVRAGDLLIALQMRTGGWFSEMPARGPAGTWWFRWGVLRTAIDDDVTPGAIRALLALHEVTGARRYRAAAERGLAFLLDRQLPSGAWPLVARPRVKQMIWEDFEDRPTLNDGATTQTLVTLLMAARLLDRADLVPLARRAGDWIVRAQHAPPHAGWAQQYDADGTKPAPARRYERVALASWETRYAIDALVDLARATGDAAYCAPVAPAARWLAASANIARLLGALLRARLQPAALFQRAAASRRHADGSAPAVRLDGRLRHPRSPAAARRYAAWRGGRFARAGRSRPMPEPDRAPVRSDDRARSAPRDRVGGVGSRKPSCRARCRRTPAAFSNGR